MVAVFVLKLIAGIVLMWLLMPRKDVTDGFFRIQMLVVLGLSVLAVLTLEPASLTGYRSGPYSVDELHRAGQVTSVIRMMQLAAAVVAYAGHVFWKLGRRGPGRVTIFLLGGLSLAALLGHSLRMTSQVPAWQQALSDLASASVLGAALTGMLLGHWYLTTPTMSIQPLTWFARALAIAGTVRLVASGLSLARFGWPSLDAWPSQDAVHALLMIVRLVGGIAVPLLMSLTVLRILRYRNTQSATGVLFAGLVLVFMGEMTAALLEHDLQVPY